MKKVIIAAAAMVMTVAANAATVQWKITGTSAENGYTAYLMSGDVVSTWESAADVQAAALDSGAIAKSGRVYAYVGNTTNDALTKTSNFYFVLVNADATQYAVSSSFAGASYVYDTTATPPETAPSVVPSFAADGATFADWAGSSTEPDTPGTGDVPEPTSGLLLVLGAAGLALRRRRA